jgi:hypothetical protein
MGACNMDEWNCDCTGNGIGGSCGVVDVDRQTGFDSRDATPRIVGIGLTFGVLRPKALAVATPIQIQFAPIPLPLEPLLIGATKHTATRVDLRINGDEGGYYLIDFFLFSFFVNGARLFRGAWRIRTSSR